MKTIEEYANATYHNNGRSAIEHSVVSENEASSKIESQEVVEVARVTSYNFKRNKDESIIFKKIGVKQAQPMIQQRAGWLWGKQE